MFSSFKCVGYGSFRRGAAVTTEAAAGSIKGSKGDLVKRGPGQDRGKKPNKTQTKRKPRTKKKERKAPRSPEKSTQKPEERTK